MKKLLLFLFSLCLFSLAPTTQAINITVPQSTAKADILVGKATGAYGILNIGSDGACLIASSTTTSGLVWGSCATGGGSGITSLNGLLGATQTFATGTATGIGLNVTSSGSVHTFTPTVSSGYVIPLSASTTQWSGFYNTPSTRITAGTNLSWSGNTLNGTMASSTIIAGGTATHSPSITFASTTDTNILLNIFCATSTCTFNPSFTGTLAAGRLNSNVVQGITNDTNITGSISAQNLTLGWTGTLAASRLNSNVVQSIVNDTNVTGSISAQALTLNWTGRLAVSRGGTGTSTLGNLTVSSSNLSITGGQQVLIGTSTQITLTGTPTFTSVSTTNASTTGQSVTGNLHLTALSNGCLQVQGGLVSSTACGGGGSLSGGTVGFVGVWASSTALTTGVLRDNGTVAGVNATSSSYSFYVRGVSSLSPFAVASTSGTSMLNISNDGTTYFTNGGGATTFPLIITSNERVGVGTTSPVSTFAVKGTGGIPSLAVASSTGNILFQIDTAGNVGIGTVSPQKLLHVWGTQSLGVMRITRDTSTTIQPATSYVTADISAHNGTTTSSTFPNLSGAAMSFSISSSTNITSPNILGTVGIVRDGNDLTGQLRIHPYRNGNAVESSTLYISGNTQTAGIGTNTPVAVWSVKGTSTAPTVPLLVVASSTGAVYLRVDNNGSTTLSSLGTGNVRASSGSLFVGPIDISADTNLAAGRSLTLSGDSVEADAELYTHKKTITLLSVGSALSATTTAAQFELPSASTITEVSCSTDTGTATIQLDERARATPNTSGTDVMTSTLVCDNNAETTTTFTNAGIAADVPVNLDIDSVASSPTRVRIHIKFTYDD